MEFAASRTTSSPVPRVMLVDDDTLQLSLVKELLGQMGVLSVQLAQTGLEGLDLYRRNTQALDVIVVDLCMPQLDGMEFLRRLALEHCQADIVIISGHNLTPPQDPDWRMAHYDGPLLHLAEKLARIQGLHVRGTFEKPLTRDKVVSMLELVGYHGADPKYE